MPRHFCQIREIGPPILYLNPRERPKALSLKDFLDLSDLATDFSIIDPPNSAT